MPPEASYYDILEVRRESTPADIERAFDRESSKLRAYPSNSQSRRKRLLEIEKAYHVLSNEPARATYDRQHFSTVSRSTEPLAESYSAGATVSFIGTTPSQGDLRKESPYKLVLAKARRTEQGLEIELAPSFWSRTAVAEELRRHIPSGFLEFNSSRNSWTIASIYEAALRELFLNLDIALNEDRRDDPQEFSLPSFVNSHRSTYQGSGPMEVVVPDKPDTRHSRWTATVNGTTLGIVAVILLIGWNLFVAGSQRQQEPDVQVVIVPPTRTPIPTATLVATPVPTPVSLLTTTRFPRVHLRAGPDQNSTSLDFLLEGEEFTAVGRTPNSEWIRIKKQGLIGWSAAWTLNLQERFEELPVVEP